MKRTRRIRKEKANWTRRTRRRRWTEQSTRKDYVRVEGVSWCFEPSPPQRITSGLELRETFIKRCLAERASKVEIRPEEQSEKAESCWENLWDEVQLQGPQRQKWDRKNRVRKRRVVGRIYGMKYSWKGHKDRNSHKNRINRSGQAWLAYVKNISRSIPTMWRWVHGDAR